MSNPENNETWINLVNVILGVEHSAIVIHDTVADKYITIPAKTAEMEGFADVIGRWRKDNSALIDHIAAIQGALINHGGDVFCAKIMEDAYALLKRHRETTQKE